MAGKLLLALFAAVVAVLLAEGAWSLLRGDSLLFPRPIARSRMLDSERIAAAALTEGAFALADDPVVGFRVKPSITRDFFEVPATTDRFGMRRRTGAAPAADAVSIVVLGDSYAFGFGVRDDETFAHALEGWLGATMADGVPAPVVHTVACPGWNFENEARYLENHLARLDPDVVIVLPVANDLDDGYVVSETGQVLALPAVDRPHCGVGHYAEFVAAIGERKRVFVGGSHTWPLLLTDLAPESRRRWDGYLAGLARLRDRLAARGAQLVVAFPERDDFQVVLHERLVRSLPDVVRIGLPGPRTAEDCIPSDPHPNGRWYAAAARVVADRMIRADWLAGAGAKPLPAPDPRYVGQELAIHEWTVEAAEAWDALFGSAFDFEATDGFWQIYGGVDAADGTVGLHCMLGLRLEGARSLALTIGRLPLDSGVYPLSLRVSCNGSVLDAIALSPPTAAGDARTTLTIALPPGLGAAVDILVAADNHVHEIHRGQSRLASFRLLRAELVR